MHEWNENSNGNYVYVIDTDDIMTVFKNRDGDWVGVYRDRFTKGSFDTAEEAMKVMDSVLEGDTSMLRAPPIRGWIKNKAGSGFHRRTRGGVVSVKQSKSGSWYAIINGSLLGDEWFKSPEAAKTAVDRYLSETQ
jgi:hypothetical protein